MNGLKLSISIFVITALTLWAWMYTPSIREPEYIIELYLDTSDEPVHILTFGKYVQATDCGDLLVHTGGTPIRVDAGDWLCYNILSPSHWTEGYATLGGN